MANATDHYVSPQGTANWSACTTIASPCAKSTAETNALNGDKVYFLDGLYTGGLHVTHNGTCSSYNAPDSQKIVLQSLNPRKAIISGNNSVSTISTILVDTNCVAIRNFAIQLPDQNNTIFGIYLTRNGDEASGNEIYYSGSALAHMHTSSFSSAEGIRANASALIKNNYIHDVTLGVHVIASASLFATDVFDNLVQNLSAGDPEDADCFTVHRNGVTNFGTGVRIFNNTCQGWVDDAFDGYDTTGVQLFNNSFSSPQPSNVSGFTDHPTCLKLGYYSQSQLIQSNHCADIPTAPAAAHCIDAQGANGALVAGNYCSGGHEGIYLQAVSPGTGINNRFVRNSIVNSSTYAFSMVQSVTGTVLNGNFLDSNDATYNLLITSGASLTGQYNVFGKSVSATGGGTYSGTGDIVAAH